MKDIARLKESVRLCMMAKIACIIWGHKGIGKSKIMLALAQAGLGESILTYRDKDRDRSFVLHRDKSEVFEIGVDGTLTTQSMATFLGEHKSLSKLIDAKKAVKRNLPMGFVDLRCSQIEAADIRGLPDKKDGRTVYLPPSELPFGDKTALEIELELNACPTKRERDDLELKMQPHYEHGILFLDELNRASDDVLQCAFQLVYDRKIGNYRVPDGWAVVSACNYNDGNYITNGFVDAAFLDRFCHIDFRAGDNTLDEWVEYMAGKHGEHASQVIDYCATNVDILVGAEGGDKGFNVTPSPRSWDRVAEVESICNAHSIDPDVKFDVVRGLVGPDAALSYQNHICPVKPRTLYDQGVKQCKDLLAKLERNALVSLCVGYIALTKGRKEDQKAANVALDLTEFLLEQEVADRDVVVAFARGMISATATGTEDMTYCVSNVPIARQIAEMTDELGTYLTGLVKRPKLHEALGKTGWDDAALTGSTAELAPA